ncbi:hypothetical protein ACFYN0_21795 [Streptomyces sp. NPDC006704]|uniref:hypothetical protein n=1 Tax=Streptomyces sp. NPDC006704 TaxID=3364760 RepID=UPI0036A05DEC
MKTTGGESLCAEFFGIGITVTAASQLAALRFRFAPHLVPEPRGADRLHVDLGPERPDGAAQFVVSGANGTPMLRRTFRAWTNVPPPVPPFAALARRFWIAPAVVLAKGPASVALLGSPYAPRAEVALALAQRSWQFVSGQLLVVDRMVGHTMPYLVPLEFYGASAAAVNTDALPEGTWHRRASAISDGVLQVRPERLGAVVPVRARLGPPALVRLCRAPGETVRVAPAHGGPAVWPPEAAAETAALTSFRVDMPGSGGAEEAAWLIDDQVTASASAGFDAGAGAGAAAGAGAGAVGRVRAMDPLRI